jgi:hypothetical protein
MRGNAVELHQRCIADTQAVVGVEFIHFESPCFGENGAAEFIDCAL